MKQSVRFLSVSAIVSCATILAASAAQAALPSALPSSVPVTVVNSNHIPVPTTVALGTPTSFTLSSAGNPYQTPLDKLLEIDSLSYSCFVPAASTVTDVQFFYKIGTELAVLLFNIPVNPKGAISGNSQTHILIPAGAFVGTENGGSDSGTSSTGCTVSVIGRLFPAS
jgi:hypothetical protein